MQESGISGVCNDPCVKISFYLSFFVFLFVFSFSFLTFREDLKDVDESLTTPDFVYSQLDSIYYIFITVESNDNIHQVHKFRDAA
jgi:hypothetical protein